MLRKQLQSKPWANSSKTKLIVERLGQQGNYLEHCSWKKQVRSNIRNRFQREVFCIVPGCVIDTIPTSRCVQIRSVPSGALSVLFAL